VDVIDLANEHAEFFRQMALKRHFCRSGKYQASEVLQYPGETPSITLRGGSHPGSHDCIDCGGKIDPARLQALPDAVRCIDCQAKKELI